MSRYDHLRKEAGELSPARVDKVSEPWRAALDAAMTAYIQSQFNGLGATSVYGSTAEDGSITLVVCIESHQFNPRNFWSAPSHTLLNFGFNAKIQQTLILH